MALPKDPQTLSIEQVEELNSKLSELRHNVNNSLSLIVAASELIKRKPDMSPRMVETISQQPQKITEEFRKFSEEFEKMLNITRE